MTNLEPIWIMLVCIHFLCAVIAYRLGKIRDILESKKKERDE